MECSSYICSLYAFTWAPLNNYIIHFSLSLCLSSEWCCCIATRMHGISTKSSPRSTFFWLNTPCDLISTVVWSSVIAGISKMFTWLMHIHIARNICVHLRGLKGSQLCYYFHSFWQIPSILLSHARTTTIFVFTCLALQSVYVNR